MAGGGGTATGGGGGARVAWLFSGLVVSTSSVGRSESSSSDSDPSLWDLMVEPDGRGNVGRAGHLLVTRTLETLSLPSLTFRWNRRGRRPRTRHRRWSHRVSRRHCYRSATRASNGHDTHTDWLRYFLVRCP